ncbi:hypothetical protein J3R82DRAFT_5721 [Butyriboletus roseoflavus]|nr:hypothetical protein J3R82DRAFT_5721 [Butyriboletus roseoflavus]
MPSLRRSFSSPSVRSSPYPSSLSTLHPSGSRARPSPIHPRRSSGSATAERRVLADIEWWRVYDGQCDLDLQDQAHEDAQVDGGVPLGGTVTLSAGGGSLEPPQTPLSLHSFALDSMQSVPPSALAALSIAPYSPPGSRHGRDSSLESTPEFPTAPLETVQLGLASPVSCPFGDHLPFPPSPTRVGGQQVHPLFALRSILAPGLSHQGSLEPDFADMGGDSFSLDQNLFQ